MKRPLRHMNSLNRIYAGAVLPALQPSTHAGLLKRFRGLERLERLPSDEVKERQWWSLLRLIQHAYETTPFYRQRFDSIGLQPSDICSPGDLLQIPPLTREDLRQHLEQLWSRKYHREALLSAATGGTTDSPVPLLRSADCLPEKTAVQIHLDSWAGLFPGDRVMRIWGAQQDYPRNPSWRWRIYDRHIMRRIWAPTSLFNAEVLESHRKALNRLRPRVIYAYPTPLALFCEHLRECGRPFHHPQSAVCTAEPLLADQRRVITETLGCPVFEHYGSRDFGMIAGECEAHNGLHLHPTAAWVERAPIDGSNGELYELLITDLLNYGMPLIRYKINDCVRPGPPICPCGRGFPLIGTIEGRTTENFYLPNGDVVPGVSLTNRVLQVCPGLKKVQVIQEAVSQFRIRYVPGSGCSIADLDLLRANLRKFFPDGLSWEFEAVNDIKRERSGKTRFCISRVDPKNWKLPEVRDGNARSAALAGVTEAAGSSAQVGMLRDGDRVQR